MTWKVEDWKVEEYVLMNMKKLEVYGQSSPRYRNGNKIYEIEKKLSNQEKVDIIDKMYNGLGSLMYNFILAWEKDKHTVKESSPGRMHKASKIAFLKKIFPQTKLELKGLTKHARIDLEYKIGEYSMFGERFRCIQTTTPTTEYGYSMEHDGKNIVNQWFHEMLKKLEREEREHFHNNNPIELKIKEIKEYAERLGQFEGRKINDIIWNGEKDVSEEYLDKVLEAYKKLESFKKYLEMKVIGEEV